MLQIQDQAIRKTFIVLVSVWTAVRLLLATFLELGNDEVYYWTFAVYPDISHFDHPGMVGWVIQLFSMNLILSSELFLRFSSLLFGVLNMGLIFLCGKELRDERTGLYAAFLYGASIYGTIISGVFILPDTPQNLFWLAGIWLFLRAFNDKYPLEHRRNMLFGAFVATGLATLSKYSGVFLGFGGVLFVISYSRSWFLKKELYLGLLSAALIITPILFWNIENDFVSFTYQGSRVDMTQGGLRPDYFATELLGQFFYNNPINVVLIVLAFLALRKKSYTNPQQRWLLLFISLPMIATFLTFSLFRQTLPHWTGPSYHGLMLITAAWLADRYNESLFPPPLRAAILLLMVVVVVGFLQIKTGLIPLPSEENPRRLGRNDPTLDMYGWKQLEQSFEQVAAADTLSGRMPPFAPIFSHRWFPAAHLDYYVAWPTQRYVYAIGSLERIHKYLWIDQMLGLPADSSDVYYITSSRDFHDPAPLFGDAFANIDPPDSIAIKRGGKPVMYHYIYRMKGLKREMLIGKFQQ